MKQPFLLGDWYVEPDRHRISRGGKSTHLQPKMMSVLLVLVEHEGQTVEKSELLDIVWPRQYVNEEVLKRIILKIRQVLGDITRNPIYIETIHRKGYRLICPVHKATLPASVPVRNWSFGSPFRSLNHFEITDSHIFFGRSTALSEAREALIEQRDRKRGFLLITGASGAGKSSFARAGLVTALLQERYLGMDDVNILRPMDMLDVPGDSRLGQLLTRLDSEQVDTYQSGQETPILLIDQFEEALVLQNCNLIMDQVYRLARSGLVDVIVTIREDFLPALSDWPAIARLKQGSGTFNLGIPSQSELAEIVQGPAKLAGFHYEVSDQYGSLRREIISKAAQVPQSLPLLQFLLHRMYEDREGDELTWASYHRQGGLVGAISKHADKVMAKLDDELVNALPELLEQLTQFDLDNQHITRRPAPMEKIAGKPHCKRLALALINARLLTSDIHADGQPYLSMVHETLLEHWDMARSWAEKNFEQLGAYRRTQIAYGNWQQAGKSTDLLLRKGKALADAESVVLLDGLDEGIQGYIGRSQSHLKRINRVKRISVSMLIVLTMVSATASYLANQQRQAAEHNLNLAKRSANFAIGLLNTASPNTSTELLTARELLDEGVRRVPVEFAQDPASRAQLLHASGRLYMQMGELDRAEELFAMALQAAGDETREKFEYMWSLAELRDLRNKDMPDKREDELLKLAIAHLKASGASDQEIAHVYWRAARLTLPEWRYSPYYWEQAFSYYNSTAFTDNRDSPEMMVQFAVLLAYWPLGAAGLRDAERALQLLAQSLEIFTTQQRKNEPAYLRALETGAVLEYSVGSTLRAIELQHDAAKGSMLMLGRLHIATPFRWHVLGDYLLSEGFYPKAGQALQQATSMYLESYGVVTPKWFEASLSLADTWFHSGKHEQARKLLDVLDSQQEQAWGNANHPETWRLWQLRGHLARSQGDVNAANTAYAQAMVLINRIASKGVVAFQKIALELDFLTVTKSTRLSDFTIAYLDKINSKRASRDRENTLGQNALLDLQRPATDMLIKLLHNSCDSHFTDVAARDLQLFTDSTWENDVWQRYAIANELAHCGYLQLDQAQLKSNAEAISRLTHPSTFMAKESESIIRKQL